VHGKGMAIRRELCGLPDVDRQADPHEVASERLREVLAVRWTELESLRAARANPLAQERQRQAEHLVEVDHEQFL